MTDGGDAGGKRAARVASARRAVGVTGACGPFTGLTDESRLHLRRMRPLHRLAAAHSVVVVMTEARSDDGRVAPLRHELLGCHVVATRGSDDSGGVLLLVRPSVDAHCALDVEVFESEDSRCIGAKWPVQGKRRAVVGVHLVPRTSHLGRRTLLRRLRGWLP